MKSKNLLLLIALFFMVRNLSAQVKDNDGNTYKTVTIGTQKWMAENLNAAHFNNGDAIPEAASDEDWEKAGIEGKPAWCYYYNDSTYGSIYGKLYNWYAITDSRGLVPGGWHLPSDPEWTALGNSLGGTAMAGSKLKDTATLYWPNQTIKGNNESGFSGLPAGTRESSGTFFDLSYIASWWSATDDNTDAWCRFISANDNELYTSKHNKGAGISVRCIKN